MRTTILLAFVLCSCVADATAQRRGGRGRAQDLTQFTYDTIDYDAPSVGGERSYGIYLPKGYTDKKNAKRTYPLVVWLHGLRGSTRRFRSGGSAVLDRMRKQGKIPEMIVVTPSASSRPTYIDRGKRRNEESMILVDLLQHVEKNYRVAKERRRRAIMGVSMGALGAMKIALKHPKKFGSVAVHSSPVLTVDPEDLGRYRRFASTIFGDPIDEKEWSKEIPIAILAKMKPADLHGLRIYFDAGSRDRYGFGPSNVDLSKRLEKAKIEHTFKYIEGGGHSWGSNAIQKAMQYSFPFVAAGFLVKPKKDKKAVEAKSGAKEAAKEAAKDGAERIK